MLFSLLFLAGCDLFTFKKQNPKQETDLTFAPYQKVALNKTDNFNAYEAALNGEYTCFISQLAPEGSAVKYYYEQIQLLFAPRLLAEVSDIKNIQGMRYFLNDETHSTTTRYARCLFPTSEKLSMLLLKHLQFDPSKPLPDDLWIDEAASSGPLSKTSVLLKMVCGRTIKSSEGYANITIEINYDDCIELHLEFLLPPDLPTHPVWDLGDHDGGGGGGVGGDLVDSDNNLPPMCPSKDKKVTKYYCDKTRVFDLNPSQYNEVKEIIDRIRGRGITCAKLAAIGDELLAQKAIVVSKIDPEDSIGEEPFAKSFGEKQPASFFASGAVGVHGAWIAIDPKNWDVTKVQYLGGRRITLEWILVHELDHILLGTNVEHISYTYAFNEPPNTTLYTQNTSKCSSDAKMSHPKTIL